MSGRWEFWIDRGGTFTDIVGRRPDGTSITRSWTASGSTHNGGMSGRWEFWIDRGGTFTDIVGRRPDGTSITRSWTASGST
ncbi:hypothetical protein, partial [Streptomyces sp. MS191]|uniref:hypothetical protein n=1 Tax=Streptomyces sp. ms191 TaxID=1827978 RepID=UPI0011CE8FCD